MASFDITDSVYVLKEPQEDLPFAALPILGELKSALSHLPRNAQHTLDIAKEAENIYLDGFPKCPTVHQAYVHIIDHQAVVAMYLFRIAAEIEGEDSKLYKEYAKAFYADVPEALSDTLEACCRHCDKIDEGASTGPSDAEKLLAKIGAKPATKYDPTPQLLEGDVAQADELAQELFTNVESAFEKIPMSPKANRIMESATNLLHNGIVHMKNWKNVMPQPEVGEQRGTAR